jgi:hypothetical protein
MMVMVRIVTTLLFAIFLIPLPGQIYAEKIQSVTGDPVALHDLGVDHKGKVYAPVYEVYSNLPSGGYGGTPIIHKREVNLKLDRTTQPLGNDSLRIISHFLEVLNSGKLLNHFYSGGGYGSQPSFQWTGYSYAMLTPQLQLKTKFYDASKSYISLRDVKTVDSNKVLGITNNSRDQSPFDSLSYFNSNTGQIFWSIQGYASMHSVWVESKVLAGAYVFSDSLRVFFKSKDDHISGYSGPFEPSYVLASSHMITCSRINGSVGQVQSLPQDLISLKHLDSNNGYALLYLDSTGSILRYEARDIS